MVVVRRRRRRPSSTVVARFVTAKANDLKLATNVALGKGTLEKKFLPDSIYDLATRGPNMKTQKVR